jgi:RNA polymerase sigma factor (sigma-70 family)
MNDWTDMRLLCEYSERGSEKAFTTLVSRHLAMVYHAALRQTRQPELAEEVVQTVFTLLAQKAGRISARTTLSGWLFNSTRFVSTRAIRDEFRRQRREKEVALMDLNSSPPETSEQAERVLSLLDGVLARLSNADREAILMRYFEGKPFLQVAAAMDSTEEAAKKRVQRALDKLRGMLGARGVVLGSATLALVLQTAAAQAAPVGLSAAGISSAALAGATGTTTLSVLTQTTLEIMKWTKIKIAATAAVAAVLAAGTTAYYFNYNQTSKPVVPETTASAKAPEPDGAAEKVRQLEEKNAKLTESLAQANSDKVRSEKARQEAEHSAAMFRELAAQAQSKDPTNAYPTSRHVSAGFGKLLRSAAQIAALDPGSLSAEDKQAYDAQKNAMGQDMLRLFQAGQQLDSDNQLKSGTPEVKADFGACFLYGALELNEQQFTGANAVLQKYYQQAAQQNLLQENPDPAQETDRQSALSQLNQQASDEIHGLLSPDQAGVFSGLSQNYQMQLIPLHYALQIH